MLNIPISKSLVGTNQEILRPIEPFHLEKFHPETVLQSTYNIMTHLVLFCTTLLRVSGSNLNNVLLRHTNAVKVYGVNRYYIFFVNYYKYAFDLPIVASKADS